MTPKPTITLSNIEIIDKSDKLLIYRIIGDEKHYRVSMRNVLRIDYWDGKAKIKIKA